MNYSITRAAQAHKYYPIGNEAPPKPTTTDVLKTIIKDSPLAAGIIALGGVAIYKIGEWAYRSATKNTKKPARRALNGPAKAAAKKKAGVKKKAAAKKSGAVSR